MNYSGNPSLSSDVKQRILSTFEQTRTLAREGSRQEALLGCDFVLRLDPQFEPARILQERLRSGSGPVSVADLGGLDGGAAGAAPSVDPFAAMEELGLDLPDLDSVPAGALIDELKTLFAQRRFQALLERAQQESAAVAADPELQRLATLAQEKLEAEPYLAKFLGAAQEALKGGRPDEVPRFLAKARSLDPDHPEIARLEAAVAGAGSASGAPQAELPSPLRPPPAAMPGGFGFPGGAAAGGFENESDGRIRELLTEGQAALDKGDPQGAIDAWSRIFLIDIDHQEAARRIDAARKVKAEKERQVEEIFHDGLAHLENGDVDAAKQTFERVLELQPTYFAAQEYLQQLAAGIVPTPPRASAVRELASDTFASPVGDGHAPAEELKEEILVPPEPGEARRPRGAPPERKPAKVAVAREGRARKLFLIVGGAVLLVVLVGGWLVYQNLDSLFPNSKNPATKSAVTGDAVARAEKLKAEGKTPIALSLLRRVQPGDAAYAKAQKLLAQWNAEETAAKAAAPPAAGEAPSPEAQAHRAELLAAARTALAERRFLTALQLSTQAGAIARLDGEDAKIGDEARRQLAPILKYVELFQQHEFELAIPELWKLHDANPADQDVGQLLADSYYNLGVRDLQRGDADKAGEKFREALKIHPNDSEVRRANSFAESYRSRDKDLLYRIFIKYLPLR
jgi:tetratricopeptide (TPR) repeat protein